MRIFELMLEGSDKGLSSLWILRRYADSFFSKYPRLISLTGAYGRSLVPAKSNSSDRFAVFVNKFMA